MEMEEVNTEKNERVKDIPPLPLKTYKWEDIRREKKKGHYPYTHLNKGPYNEEIDIAEFKMDTLRSSKSASTLEKSSSGVDIREVTETADVSVNNGKDYLEVSEGIVEAADSSNEDNVSQYLDKEEDLPVITEHVETPGPSKEKEKMDVDTEEQRAKSEEPKRKRKLSIESSYSRISLSKLGVMKKLREAKQKLKLPKFSFSKSESKLDIPKKSKKESSKSESKESKKESMQAFFEPKKDQGPLYIHIPLKPPPGQTDEFSHLEFEDPKAESSSASQPENSPSNGQEKDESAIPEDQNEQQKEGLQFIILTPPSDDEQLDGNVMLPDTPSSESGKKFFNNTKLKDLKTLAKECVREITPDMPIEGIYFEDVIQVEYVDEHNRSIGKTERSNVLEVTEENLSTIERKLSQRNLAKELEKEIATSMDSLHRIARQNTLKRLKEQKSKSNETLRKSDVKPKKTQEAPELSLPPSDIVKPVVQVKEAPAKITFEKIGKRAITKAQGSKKAQTKEVVEEKSEKTPESKSEVPEAIIPEKKEIQKAPKENTSTPQEEKTQSADTVESPMYDEEDGLKLSETAVKMINEELAKEQLPKTDAEQLTAAVKDNSIKKKVSFKRRSKQEDPHGVYEDVQVTSDNKKVDGKEQQTKELKMINPSQSMSVDEEKTYLDDKIMKTTSLEEDYNKWSKLTDHEYEPVNPPAETETPQLPSPQEVQPPDTSLQRSSSKQSKKSTSDSIRIPLKDEDDVVRSEDEAESGDALTVEEMQARIEDKFFNKTESEHPPANITPAATSPSSKENVSQESSAKKIQDAFKTQAGKLRTKIKNIKRPNIHMPQRPNLEKFKIQKPNITMPKIPDQMRVNLPSFTLPKKSGSSTRKRPVKQYSTESNAGDSKKKLFDFSTYPRFFKKKKKPDDIDDNAFSESATVPRIRKSSKSRQTKETDKKKKSPDVVRIPLHSEESMDKVENDLSSRARYEEDNIDMDDAFLKESQQMRTASALHDAESSRNRWNHGSFHGHNLDDTVTDEKLPKDSPLEMDTTEVTEITEITEVERPQTSPEPDLEPEIEPEQHHSDMRLVSSFGDVREHGVLEKINSDEYFMQMGNYASKEIQEAFKQPTNPLAKMQADDSFDREFDISDQSIQEVPKRKPIKKPKRKKTPNVSKERIPYDLESEGEEYPEPYNEQPTRPIRRSKHKKHTQDEKPPYQETIFIPDPEFEIMRKAASDNMLLSERGVDGHFTGGLYRQGYPQFYENEQMQGIEQPNILISHPYQKEEFLYNEDNLDEKEKEIPEAPPRKQRSLKSLVSEHDSIIDEINRAREILPQENVEINKLEHEYIIPTPEEPPVRPARTRSRTRSHSRTTNQQDELETAEAAELLETPCVEEPCVQQICDYMGYAVIAKNRYREPPLPKKRSAKSETKFFTVPRPLKEDTPVRPVRNYSTLVPKSKRSPPNSSEEEKENVDLGQYIEIEGEGEHSRLQSGEIVQKMKDRPLPAPPRPPRKTKDSDKDMPFTDITHKNNVDDEDESIKVKLEEAEASVQTEPLPDDVVCEELVEEKGDKIIIPTTSKFHKPITEFENVETITHAALVVTPVPEDFQEGPIASFSRSTEKIITVRREVNDGEPSDVPENFRNLTEPQPRIIERIIERSVASSPEVEVLKAQKLQVSDLDVDRLTVNELLASKIKVSEIDSDSISVAEINPKSGNLVIGGFELPLSFIQEIVDKLRRPESSSDDQSTTQLSQHESAPKKQITSDTREKEPSEQQPEVAMENIMHKVGPEEVSSNLGVDNTIFSTKSDDQQQSFSEDPPQTLKFEESDTTLTAKDDKMTEENITRSSPELVKEDLFVPTSELSPTSLKTTIEYLDDLIREENMKLDLQSEVEQENQENLEDSKDDLPTGDILSIIHPGQENFEGGALEEIPSLISDTSEEERLIEELKMTTSDQKKTSIEDVNAPPKRPPRQSDIHRLQQSQEDIFIPSQIIENSHNVLLSDSTPPPRPPDPEERLYLRSQPPASFYVLRSPGLEDFGDEDIPMPPRRKKPPRPPSRSSSEEALATTPRTRRHRTPEPSIPQLAGQLTRACASASEKAFRRFIKHITMNVLRNADGKQDLHVMILILLILIAGLILLGNGGNPEVHHYHWEYFNPPKGL